MQRPLATHALTVLIGAVGLLAVADGAGVAPLGWRQTALQRESVSFHDDFTMGQPPHRRIDRSDAKPVLAPNSGLSLQGTAAAPSQPQTPQTVDSDIANIPPLRVEPVPEAVPAEATEETTSPQEEHAAPQLEPPRLDPTTGSREISAPGPTAPAGEQAAAEDVPFVLPTISVHGPLPVVNPVPGSHAAGWPAPVAIAPERVGGPVQEEGRSHGVVVRPGSKTQPDRDDSQGDPRKLPTKPQVLVAPRADSPPPVEAPRRPPLSVPNGAISLP